MNKKKKMNILLSVAVALFLIGSLLLSYGVYSSNPSTQTLTGNINFESDEKPFENKANIQSLSPSIYRSDFDPEAIDQIQDSFPGGLNQYIGNDPLTGNNLLFRQTGFNDREPWNGFEVIIARHGMPTEPLYIGIRDDTSNYLDPLTGDYDYLGYIDASGLPASDAFYWVGKEYQIPGITANDEWAIILISANDGGFDNYWMWACSDQNPYSRGEARGWNGAEWVTAYGGVVDLCFRTYTIPNGGEEPTIAITATYTVIPMAFGFLSLLGAAVVTGVRYFWIGAL